MMIPAKNLGLYVLLIVLFLRVLNLNLHAQELMGEGPQFDNPVAMDIDQNGNLFVVDNVDGKREFEMIQVDLQTGNREIVHTYNLYNVLKRYQNFSYSIVDIALSSGNNHFVVVKNRRRSYIVRVNPFEQTQTILTEGRSDDTFNQILYTKSDRLFAASAHAGILEIDLETGSPTLVSGENKGEGVDFRSFYDFEADTNGYLYVSEFSITPFSFYGVGITRIDIETGNRHRFYEFPPFMHGDYVPCMTLSEEGHLVIVDRTFDKRQVIEINPTNFEQRIMSDFTQTEGPGFINPTEIVQHNGDFYILEQANRSPQEGIGVVMVNGETGQMNMISGYNMKPQEELNSLTAVEALPDGEVLLLKHHHSFWFSGFGTLFRMNPDTGERTIISNRTQGVCRELRYPHDLAIDALGRVLAVDPYSTPRKNVKQFDPVTGQMIGAYELKGILFGSRIVLEPDGSFVMAGGDSVYRFDERSKRIEEFATYQSDQYSDDQYTSAAVKQDGIILVGRSWTNTILAIDPVSGEVNELKVETTNEPYRIFNVRNMIVNTKDEIFAVVGSEERGRLVKIDEMNGKIMSVSNQPVGYKDMTVLPNGDIITISNDKVFRVNTQNGDVEIINENVMTNVDHWTRF